jgi:hypothetical protein
MKKLVWLMAFLVIVASTILPSITITHTAYADDWYQSYGYRRSITINGSADGAQTNYQLKLTVNNSSGVSSGSTVYLNGSSLNFPNDIRFTNSSKTSLLDYWVETNTSVVATVWVEFDSIVTGATNQSTFYIYYGNASAASASNASTTFIIWNDGTSVTGWTDKDISGKGSITWASTSGKIRGTADSDYDGGFLYCNTQTGINSYFVHTEITAGDGLTGLNTQEGLVHAATQQQGDVGHARWVDLDNKWSITDEAGGSDTSGADGAFDASQTNEYILTRNASISALYVNGALKISHSKSSWSPQYIGFYYYGQTAAHYSGYDNTFVGKWVYNAPTITAWGAATSPITYYTLSVTGNNSAGTPYFTGSSPFESGTTVNIYGNLTNSCYTFAGWTPTTNIASPSSVNTTITMNATASLTANYAIKTYTLTYTNGSNGGITGSLSQTVNCSANGSAVTAGGNANYHFVNWSDASTQNPRTDTNVVANISVTANFVGDDRTLTYNAGANGHIDGSTPQTVPYGTNGTAITADPDTCYHFVNWSDASTQNPRTDTNVVANISVTANFEIDPITLTYNDGLHGSISGDAIQNIDCGDNGTAVEAIPDPCYHFTNWSDAETDNPRTDLAVTSNITVTANYDIDIQTVEYIGGANGAVNGSWPQNVDCGDDGDWVLATADPCYHFVDWDDASTDNPRQDTNVTSNISVTANFEIDVFTVEYSAGAGGTVNGSWPENVDCGDDSSWVLATADPCYHFVNWSDSSTTNPRQETNITSNLSLTANFEIDVFTVDYTAGANGAILGDDSQSVDCGDDAIEVTADPDTCYHFVNWSDASTDNPRTDLNVLANISVTANFEIDVFTVDYIAGANGAVNGSWPENVNCGDNSSWVEATPDPCYIFVNWSDSSTDNPRQDTNVTSNISLTANFAITAYELEYIAGANGDITGDLLQTIDCGDNGTEVEAVPDACYHFVNWSDASIDNPRTDLAIGANLSVTANFAIDVQTVDYIAGANGTVNGSWPENVDCGDDSSWVLATADPCYHFVNWSDSSTTNPRQETNVTSNVSLTANFAIDVFTVEYIGGANGAVNGSWPENVNCGDNSSWVEAIPDACYHFVNWSDASTDNPRQDTNITVNISYTANFEVDIKTLEYIAGANGDITGNLDQNVNCGSNGTEVEAIPDACYTFLNWSDASTDNPRTDLNVVTNISVTANFEIDTFTLTYNQGLHGTITGDTPQIVDCGSDGTEVEAIPSACYTFLNWSDASTDNPRTDLNISADITVTANYQIIVYILEYIEGANGTITGNKNQNVNCGSNGTQVQAIPNTCYAFLNWSDSSVTNPRTDINISSNLSVTANFILTVKTVTFAAGANGTVNGSWPENVDCGDDSSWVLATADPCYHFVNWSDSSTTNPRQETNVTSNISYTANFAIDIKTVTYAAGANGTINGSWPQNVNCGSNGSWVLASPNACYHFENWSDASTTNPRHEVNVTTNVSYTANFNINTYTLTYNAGAGGSIVGSTPQNVNCGSDGTQVTATPNSCYHFTSWSDGVLTASRTELNVVANKTVTANFAINVYILTYGAGANGAINGSSPQNINCGGDGTAITAIPNSCYHFTNWSDASTNNPRTDLNVVANITVVANFAINVSTLTYAAGVGGTINGTSPQNVNCGSNGTAVTAVPDPCFSFLNWSDGKTSNPRTDTNVIANISVTANFNAAIYTLTYTAGAGGTINGTTPQSVDCLQNGSTVTAIPNACYKFVNWSDSIATAARTDLNISANLNVTANFAIITYTLNVSSGDNGDVTTPTEGIHTYNCGQVVNLVATPDLHYWFDEWTGNITTIANVNDATTTITMNGNYSIVANFIPSTDLFPPTNISVTQTSSMCLNISWDIGLNSVGTLVIICEDEVPTDCIVPDLGNLSAGCYVLYNGSDTSASYCGIDTTIHEYYITFWGTDGAGHYSVTCENETLGGAEMTGVMLLGILLFLGVAFFVVALWQRQWWIFMVTGLLWFIIMAYIFTQYSTADMEYWVGYVALIMALVCIGCVFWFREKHEHIAETPIKTDREELADHRAARAEKINNLRNMRNNLRGDKY